jgi:hypothetical protein
MVTDNIIEVYDRISSSFPELLHPILSKIALQAWGVKEFVLMDKQPGAVIQQPKKMPFGGQTANNFENNWRNWKNEIESCTTNFPDR